MSAHFWSTSGVMTPPPPWAGPAMLNHSFSEEIFLHVQPELFLAQLEGILRCLIPFFIVTNCRFQTEVSVCCYPLIFGAVWIGIARLSFVSCSLGGSAWTVADSSASEKHVLGLEIGKPWPLGALPLKKLQIWDLSADLMRCVW